MTKFSELIKKYREENNLTQQEFAEKLHVSRQAVSKWETGSSYPNYEILKDIALLLNTTVDNLLSQEEIVKETINVKSKNKRNVMLILLSSLAALIAIVIGIVSIIIASNNKKVEEQVQEELNVKYLGFFMRIEEFGEEGPTVEEYNKGIYPGIYIYEINGKYDRESTVRTATDLKVSVSSDKKTYETEFVFNVNRKLLCEYYAYLKLDTNEVYFEKANLATMLNKDGSYFTFVERNDFKGIIYEYKISIRNIDDSKQTKILEYNNEFKLIKETVVDFENPDVKDNYYTLQYYKVTDDCLYLVIEDTFDNKLEKRMIWREDLDKRELLYHSKDDMFSSFIVIKK